MNPREIAVCAGKLVELRLLAHPENAIGHDAHQIHDEPRRERHQRVPQVVLGMNRFRRRNAQIEHQQRHGNGENSVTQRGETFDALSGNTVVERRHTTKSSWLLLESAKSIKRLNLFIEFAETSPQNWSR